MQSFTVKAVGLEGVTPFEVLIRVSTKPGTGVFVIPGTEEFRIREARVRILSALCVDPSAFPRFPITQDYFVSVTRAGKEIPYSASYDFALAVACCGCLGAQIPTVAEQRYLVGEIALDGALRPVRGALCMATLGPCVFPRDNGAELGMVDGSKAILTRSLHSLFSGAFETVEKTRLLIEPVDKHLALTPADLADLEGMRRVLLVGEPGVGFKAIQWAKTVNEKHRDEITETERFEVLQIHSVAGVLPWNTGWGGLPLRSPHHSVSEQGLIGGSGRPGEVSLAHRGVLLLDDLDEFRLSALRTLRDTLRRGKAGHYHADPWLVVGTMKRPAPKSPERTHRLHRESVDAIADLLGMKVVGI